MAWRIGLLGPLTVAANGAAISLAPLRQAERILLEILALRRGHVVPREELAELVFGHLDADRAGANLRVAASRLRTALGSAELIDGRDGGYQIAGDVTVDVEEFERRADAGRAALADGRAEGARVELVAALALYRGDLLESDAGAEWAMPLRTRLRGRRGDALDELADAAVAVGRNREAVGAAERAIELEPTRESAYRRLMTAHYAAGEQDAALSAYERCRHVLSEELGVDPLPETRTLHERILRQEPIAVPRAGAARTTHHGLPFTAREPERIVLESAIARAAQGGVFVLVIGEPGAGKTRLVEETLRSRSDVSVLACRCYELERELPFQPLRDALGDRVPTKDVAADQARATLIESCARAVLASAQGRPLVWWIDDVQWADRSTLAVVHHVARRSADQRIAIVVSGHDDALPPEHPVGRLLTDLRREGRAERIKLAPLTADDVATLARTANVAREQALAIHRRSGGNAFFVTELLMAARRGSAAIPETARDAVLARTRVLPADVRQALDVAAVLGARFRNGELAALAQIDDATAARLLGALEDLGLARALPNGEHEVAHELVRDAVYDDAPAAVRSELHKRAIGVLEASRGEDGVHLICYHAERAGDADCAFACAIFAGERALGDHAGDEALASFDRALRQPTDAESRRRCLTLRAEAKRELGLADEASADLAAAAAIR